MTQKGWSKPTVVVIETASIGSDKHMQAGRAHAPVIARSQGDALASQGDALASLGDALASLGDALAKRTFLRGIGATKGY